MSNAQPAAAGKAPANKRKTPIDATASTPQIAIIRTRWVLAIAIGYTILFGTRGRVHVWPDEVFIGVMLVSNLLVTLLRNRVPWRQLLEVATVADVVAVTLVVAFVEPSTEAYLVQFAVLILATALGRVGMVAVLMLLACVFYGVMLYDQVGPSLWYTSELLVRLPFLFGVAIHFATVTRYLKDDEARMAQIEFQARQIADRAQQVVEDRDRLRALSQIGRLGLTGAGSDPAKVLLEIGQRAQQAVSVERFSLVVFDKEGRRASLAATSDDQSIDIRTLDLDKSELAAILADGKINELRPGSSRDIWGHVKRFFPESNPFGTLLVAPVTKGESVFGALFLQDADAERSFSDAEYDFCWTVALMIGAFVHGRDLQEKQESLQTLITNAPLLLFVLDRDGVFTLLEGKIVDALNLEREKVVGRSAFELYRNSPQALNKIEVALAGTPCTTGLELAGLIFEAQCAPARDANGKLSGVIGVATEIIEQGAERAETPQGEAFVQGRKGAATA